MQQLHQCRLKIGAADDEGSGGQVPVIEPDSYVWYFPSWLASALQQAAVTHGGTH